MSYPDLTGLQIPSAPKPSGNYVPVVQTGTLVFVSGMGPRRGNEVAYCGKVGKDLTVKDGYEAARLCALNCLAMLRDYLGGLERVARVVKIVGFVNSAPGFSEQPAVVNGASDLLVQVFGDRGKHARSAIGAAELPRNIAVEIEMVAEIASD